MIYFMVIILLILCFAQGHQLTIEHRNKNESKITGNICPECSRYLAFCRILRVGYVVQLPEDLHKIQMSDSQENNNFLLAKCVPNNFQINGLLEGSACFWSPELGCNLLMGRRKQESGYSDLYCLECFSRCPCSKASTLHMEHVGLATMCLGLILVSKLVLYEVKVKH